MTRIFDYFSAKKLTRTWVPTFDRRCPLEAVWIDADSHAVAAEDTKGGARCQ